MWCGICATRSNRAWLRVSERPADWLARAALPVAALLSVFHLWQPLAGFVPPGVLPFEELLGLLPATYLRPTHLGWVLVIGLLVYPLPGVLRVIDGLLVAATVWATYRVLAFDYQSLTHLLHGLQAADFGAGLVLLLVALEVARRSVGVVMLLVGVVFLLYAAFGNLLPDVLATRGFSFERIVRFQVFTQAGLFGAPIGIAAGTVFCFVLFGAFLQATGAGKFFIDLSFAAAGRFRGGPAKASVLASAAMGSISGSAIANSVTTGAMTIPMMKQLGYKPAQAAGIEAAASTGGQIMPPIMGAGAFVMAEFTKTSYGEIVWMSLVPALLYFASVLLYVHIFALKRGLQGMSDVSPAARVLADGLHYVLPLALITVLLLLNYSPVLVGVSGCAGVVFASMLRRSTRIGLREVGQALQRGALMAVPISVACAIAGVVVGTIGQTGIGLQFTESVVGLSGGRLWMAMLLVAFAALVLGMGLPVTAAYIVLAVMTGPALQDLGLSLITAHMVVFWLSQTSNVTPPIALAAFAAAGVAGAPPMRSAVEAFKLASGLFLIPLMMAYSTLLLGGSNGWADVAVAAVATLSVMLALAMASERFLFTQLPAYQALVAAAAAALTLVPVTRWWGVLLTAVLLAMNLLAARRTAPTAT